MHFMIILYYIPVHGQYHWSYVNVFLYNFQYRTYRGTVGVMLHSILDDTEYCITPRVVMNNIWGDKLEDTKGVFKKSHITEQWAK